MLNPIAEGPGGPRITWSYVATVRASTRVHGATVPVTTASSAGTSLVALRALRPASRPLARRRTWFWPARDGSRASRSRPRGRRDLHTRARRRAEPSRCGARTSSSRKPPASFRPSCVRADGWSRGAPRTAEGSVHARTSAPAELRRGARRTRRSSAARLAGRRRASACIATNDPRVGYRRTLRVSTAGARPLAVSPAEAARFCRLLGETRHQRRDREGPTTGKFRGSARALLRSPLEPTLALRSGRTSAAPDDTSATAGILARFELSDADNGMQV
jgi:hypothetical protein